MKPKKSYKTVPAAAVVREYRRDVILTWVLHVLTIPLASLFLWLGISGRITLFNGILTAAGALFANYLIRVLRSYKLNQVNAVLNRDCDPVKFETVFRTIRDGGWKSPVYTLNIAKARYYQGDWQGAMTELNAMQKPKDTSVQILQYYNLLVNCLEMEGNFDRIVEVREKVKKITTAAKEKSPLAGNGRQLLSVIDGVLAFHRKNITRARELYENLFDCATFTLSRITALWKLAQMDQLTGAGRSAVERCDYIIDAGGTTFYVKEAERIQDLCYRRSPKTEDPQEDPHGAE